LFINAYTTPPFWDFLGMAVSFRIIEDEHESSLAYADDGLQSGVCET
jgi:hypothetical protein